MNDLPDLVKKAFYLGVGVASYAGEQAGSKVAEIQDRAQKLADEMIRRGELTAEEANLWVSGVTQKPAQVSVEEVSYPDQPQRIELIGGDEDLEGTDTDDLHRQVDELQDELRRLQDEDMP
ncbi:MAG: hypothetical protein HC934_03685 [Acaryochloridaceae cyanobacterium SU_2_1]|nr:hypothetical protein [Acaryochloridaceae cyanobacterium SU_2_1]